MVTVADIVNRLNALGVTLAYDKDPAGLPAGVMLQRQKRAALYIDRLERVAAFLTGNGPAQLQTVLGANFGFFQDALTNHGDLLNGLAESFDIWVSPAIEAGMIAQAGPPQNTYDGYLDQEIYANPAVIDQPTLDAAVTAWLNTFLLAQQALDRLEQNFCGNIQQACVRIAGDRQEIADLFEDEYSQLALQGLASISSTGSDFHKGGQQVLILTFDIAYVSLCRGQTGTLKLIYKPADVEIDLLITGNTAAANAADPGQFLQPSLAELWNAQLRAAPLPDCEPLPTYRILPRNRCSAHVGGPPVPIRQAYGYIEFLNYALEGMEWTKFNFYPLGSSDYLLFRTTPASVAQAFYRQAGHWMAIAATFGFVDQHIQNVRARSYQPNMIDLEVSLTSDVDDVRDTQLLKGGQTGGFNGEFLNVEDYYVEFAAGNNPNAAWLADRVMVDVYYQNRLYTLGPPKQLVKVDPYWFNRGLEQGLRVLRAMQAAPPDPISHLNPIQTWLARVGQGVLVRLVPVGTGRWGQARTAAYWDTLVVAPATQPALSVGQARQSVLDELWNAYDNAVQAGGAPDPAFAAVAWAQTQTDLMNFDIPTYYHQIGTIDLLDSAGVAITVPAQIPITGQANPVNTNVGRLTYFAAAPTAGRVVPQLTALGAAAAPPLPDGAGVRFNALRPQADQIITDPNANPGILVQ